MIRDISIFDIAIDQIEPHPQNPRKDLGDLTELCESIKANGIMQNLTVVPLDDQYTRFRCVIGHRRLAAAKKVGLHSVPATIADGMDEKEQIAVMVAENMQRADLTIPEQAQAVQLMLDLGEDFESIAGRTGLSESTVRRWAKLAAYDKKALDKALRRGASLLDIEKIDQIEDAEKREQLLKAAGTNNFNNLFKDFRDRQEGQKLFTEISAILEKNGFRPFSEKPQSESGKYIRNLWDLKNAKNEPPIKDPEQFKQKLPADAVLYYKEENSYSGHISIDLYYTSESADAAAGEEKREADRMNQWIRSVKRINTRFHEMRVAHIKKVLTKGKREKPFFESIVAGRVVKMLEGYGTEYGVRHKYNSIVKKAEIKPVPEMKLYLLVALDFEYKAENGCLSEWDCKYKKNESIPKIYELLAEDGYEQADEEIAYYNGTHKIWSQNPKAAGESRDERGAAE